MRPFLECTEVETEIKNYSKLVVLFQPRPFAWVIDTSASLNLKIKHKKTEQFIRHYHA